MTKLEDIGPIRPVGSVVSSLQHVDECPRQPDEGAPAATLKLRREAAEAAAGLEPGDRIMILTWLHLADRSALITRPRDDPAREPVGVFATRSPDRPNPIGVHTTTITKIRGAEIDVAQFEAVEGTPIIDIKPLLGSVSQR